MRIFSNCPYASAFRDIFVLLVLLLSAAKRVHTLVPLFWDCQKLGLYLVPMKCSAGPADSAAEVLCSAVYMSGFKAVAVGCAAAHVGIAAQRILRTKTVARGGREGAVWAPSHTHGGAMGAKKARATLGAGNPTGRGKSCCFSVKILKPSSPKTCFGGVPYKIGSPSRKRGVPIKIEGLPRPPRAPGVRQLREFCALRPWRAAAARAPFGRPRIRTGAQWGEKGACHFGGWKSHGKGQILLF